MRHPVSLLARSAPALAAALLLSACSFMPTYERPVAPVPEAFPDTPAAAQGLAERDWRAFLAGDARLQALVALALQNNRDLRVATLNVEQVRAQLGIQRADLYPSLGVGLQGSSTPAGGGNQRAYSLGLSVPSYELDLFGRVRSLTEAAAARYLASDEGRRAAQVSLVSAVVSAELALRADAAQLALTQRTLDSRNEALRLVKLRFDGGVSAAPELRNAESLQAAARVSLAALQRQQAQNRNALALLVGQGLPGELPAANGLPELPDLPVGLPSEVLLQRPDIRAAEQQLVAANANIGAARAAFFPRISLTGSAGFASTELGSLFDNTAWSFTGQLLQPLFDAGRNRANLAGAEAGRDIAVAQYEGAIQAAFREVADALAGRATLAEQLQAQQRQLQAEEARNRLVELRWRNGAASSLERLDAQRSLFTAQQALVQQQAIAAQNLTALYRVLGGGWKAGGTP
jgi:NodT family efflux transporter outer membrane factor (OMF) lipoprotein